MKIHQTNIHDDKNDSDSFSSDFSINSLSFNWNLTEYGHKLLLSITGDENKVKKITRDILLGGAGCVQWIKRMDDSSIKNYVQFDISLHPSGHIELFHYLIQEYNEIPNFCEKKLSVDQYGEVMRSLYFQGYSSICGLSNDTSAEGTPFQIAEIALNFANEKIKNGEKFILKSYTYKDVISAYGHCKVGEQLLFDDEKKLLEEEKLDRLKKFEHKSSLANNNLFSNSSKISENEQESLEEKLKNSYI